MLIAISWGGKYITSWDFRRAMSRESMAKDAENSQKVHDQLVEIRALTGADRAYVFLFHNGAHLSTGLPMKKMSCAYESCASGTASKAFEMSDLLVSRYPILLNLLTKKPQPYLMNVDTAENSHFKTLKQLHGTHYVVVHLLVNDGLLIGWMGVDFHSMPVDFNSKFYTDTALRISEIMGIPRLD